MQAMKSKSGPEYLLKYYKGYDYASVEVEVWPKYLVKSYKGMSDPKSVSYKGEGLLGGGERRRRRNLYYFLL